MSVKTSGLPWICRGLNSWLLSFSLQKESMELSALQGGREDQNDNVAGRLLSAVRC